MLSVSLTRKVSRLQGADGIFGKGGTDAKVFITLHDEDGQSTPEYALNGELQPGEGKPRDDRKPPKPLTKRPPRYIPHEKATSTAATIRNPGARFAEPS